MIGDKVFISKKAGRANRQYNILNLIGCKEQKWDVGLEVEVEGNKFPKPGPFEEGGGGLIPSAWSYHNDGSLRGEDNAEYVLKKPVAFDVVPDVVNDLWKMFDTFGSKLDESNRTSVHVHLNVQQWHLNRLCSFLGLYFSVEELLTAWCGDHRVGNLFCLRAKDAPAIVSRIKRFIATDGANGFTDGLHYSALNAQAIQKFGSVEIRTLRGVTDPDLIIKWVAILRRLYDLSAEFPDPRTVCANFSGNGPLEYLQMVLGEHTSTIRDGIDYDGQQVMEALYTGIRLAQDICYCRDWDEFKAVEITPDPFGRNAKKIAKKVMSYADYADYYQESLNTIASTSLGGPATISDQIWANLTLPPPGSAPPPLQTYSLDEEYPYEEEPDF